MMIRFPKLREGKGFSELRRLHLEAVVLGAITAFIF
jgi:hypothetical protein